MVVGASYPNEINGLIDFVRLAGDVLLSYWPSDTASHEALHVEIKGDGSPVSEADLRSNAILLEGVASLFPNDAVLSEECPIEVAKLRSNTRVWIIDPLDGTKSFIAGRDDFSVLVGLAEGFEPTIGIMYFPARGVLAVAHRGEGAYVGEQRLEVSKALQCSPGRVYIRNFESKRPELASEPMDSGLALLKVATGELDGAVIRMTTHREWDLAAPAAIIEGAGGRLTDERGKSLKFGTGELSCLFVIASNGDVHDELLELT
jgi:3'-phosphoadenosine 5'-phosphosulfate (PAPS) 3'-phosphatase